MTRYVWVAARKAEGFPTTMACEVAEVSRQAFYDWTAREAAGPTPRQLADGELVKQMREIHAEFNGTYGVPRMTVELANRGRPANHKRVERLMRANEIVGHHKAPKVRTTIPAEDNPPMPDLVGRGFAPGAPDVCWCAARHREPATAWSRARSNAAGLNPVSTLPPTSRVGTGCLGFRRTYSARAAGSVSTSRSRKAMP